MTPEEYTKQCRRTEARKDWEDVVGQAADNIRLLHTTMGIATEAGEVLDILKKDIFYNREFDREHFLKELGDVLWYLTMAADIVGSNLETVMDMNVAKLAARYPEKFTTDLANNRKEGDI